MNAYYHEFLPGFNYWYIGLPVALLLIAFLAYHGVGLKHGKIKTSFFGKLGVALMLLSTAAFPLALIFESGAGIVQVFDNRLRANDSPVYSLFFAGLAIAFLAIVYFLIARSIFVSVKDRKVAKLRQIQRQQRAQEARASQLRPKAIFYPSIQKMPPR